MRARVADAGASDDEDDDMGAALLAPVRRVVEVTVSDTGIGIPSAVRGKVFDAFYQVDSSSTREYGGTGLGLSIVKRIVDAHGGSVKIQGNEPAGTVFVVTLPSAQARRTLPSTRARSGRSVSERSRIALLLARLGARRAGRARRDR